MATVLEHRDQSAREIVGAVFGAMQAFRGDAPQTDDQTVVVVKILPHDSTKDTKGTKDTKDTKPAKG
jgi:hypothetical protein